MDPNTARSKLKINGYVHPESQTSSYYKKTNCYRTQQDIEIRSSSGSGSGSASESQSQSQNISPNGANSCPICFQIAKEICNCAYNDKCCENNHYWYTGRDGNIKIGRPNHKK